MWDHCERKGIRRKNGGNDGGGQLISPDIVMLSRMVKVSAFVIFPCTMKVENKLSFWHRLTWVVPEKGLCMCYSHLQFLLVLEGRHLHTYTSYWQQLSEGTKDAISRPDPMVGSWSTSRQRPTRPGHRLPSCWTVTANTAVKCWRSFSRKGIHHQLSIVSCTPLIMLLLNGWRHTAHKCTQQQQLLH